MELSPPPLEMAAAAGHPQQHLLEGASLLSICQSDVWAPYACDDELKGVAMSGQTGQTD